MIGRRVSGTEETKAGRRTGHACCRAGRSGQCARLKFLYGSELKSWSPNETKSPIPVPQYHVTIQARSSASRYWLYFYVMGQDR